MPRKKAEEFKAPATSVSASHVRTASTEAAAGEKLKEIRSEPKAVRSEPQAAASAPAAKAKAPAAKAKAPAAKAKATAPKEKNTSAPTNGHSILNLNDAVNGYVSAEQVAERAYFHWLERGSPIGTPEEDWFYAERELSISH